MEWPFAEGVGRRVDAADGDAAGGDGTWLARWQRLPRLTNLPLLTIDGSQRSVAKGGRSRREERTPISATTQVIERTRTEGKMSPRKLKGSIFGRSNTRKLLLNGV